jgi:hypothetical protein
VGRQGGEAEKACRSLEEEVQHGKEESAERSLGGGDEARELRERITILEKGGGEGA